MADWTAIAGVAGVISGGIVGLGGIIAAYHGSTVSQAQAEANRDHDRTQRHNDRISDARGQAYVALETILWALHRDLLRLAKARVEENADVSGVGDRARARLDLYFSDESAPVFAAANLYGSVDTDPSGRDFDSSARDLVSRICAEDSAAADVRASADTFHEAYRALRGVMRAELHSGRA